MEVKENKSIETVLLELEELIIKLEDKDCPLEESFELYKKGISMVKYCNEEIRTVENQLVEIEAGGDEDGF